MASADISATDHQFVLPYVSREGWNARQPRSEEALRAPVTHVRYTFTGTPKCLNEEDCTQAVEDLQRKDLKDGLSDIRYNFLVGAAGIVFEGRGWHADAHRPEEFAHLKGRCLDIAYIGDYSRRIPPMYLVTAALDLIRYGMEKCLIIPIYNVIPLMRNTNKEFNNETNPVKIPPWEQVRSALDLLRYGLRKEFIHPAYKVVPLREKALC